MIDDSDDLFSHSRHRNDDPDTSVEAAEAISPRIRELQGKVLRFAADHPDGFTDRGMGQYFNTHGSTYRTRRSELTEMGMIRDSGERHTYEGSGRRHIIWQITMKGLNKVYE